MKKRIWICGAVLILAAVAAGVTMLAMPQNFFKSGDQLEIYRIEYVDPQNQLVDITDEIDLEALQTYLPLMQCRRFRTQFAPMLLEDYRYEISLMDNTHGRLVHILLGDSGINYIYLSADQGGYKIYDNDTWLTILELLETGKTAD